MSLLTSHRLGTPAVHMWPRVELDEGPAGKQISRTLWGLGLPYTLSPGRRPVAHFGLGASCLKPKQIPPRAFYEGKEPNKQFTNKGISKKNTF